MGRVLVTRRLPDGGLDPLAGHELVGPNADDAPFTPDELRAQAAEVDGIVCVLTDRIDADLLKAGAAGRLRVVANVAVEPGDWIVADVDGVVVLPGAELDAVLTAGAARTAKEAALFDVLRAGGSTVEEFGLDVSLVDGA